MRIRHLPVLPKGERPTIASGPNPEAARRALRTCLEGEPVQTVAGRCPRCGYGTSISEQIRFQIDCMALEEVGTAEDLALLGKATLPRRRRGTRDVICWGRGEAGV